MHNPEILFAHDLHITNLEFAVAWNSTPECREVGVASVAPTSAGAKQFDPMLAAVGVVVLGLVGQVAVGLATNALYDLLKDRVLKALKKKDPQSTAQVEVLPQADGLILIVVHPRDGVA